MNFEAYRDVPICIFCKYCCISESRRFPLGLTQIHRGLALNQKKLQFFHTSVLIQIKLGTTLCPTVRTLYDHVSSRRYCFQPLKYSLNEVYI